MLFERQGRNINHWRVWKKISVCLGAVLIGNYEKAQRDVGVGKEREGEKAWSPGKLAEWAVAKEMLGLHGEVRTARATRASLGVPLCIASCPGSPSSLGEAKQDSLPCLMCTRPWGGLIPQRVVLVVLLGNSAGCSTKSLASPWSP